MIYQELTLAPHLTVRENIMLGRETSKYGFLRSDRRTALEVMRKMGHGDIDIDLPVGELTIGRQQIIEIARASAGNARLVIMDEPTSSLSSAAS